MADVLDAFRSDAFSVIALTDLINKEPFVPGRAGTLIDWSEQGIDVLDIMLEEISGEIRILNPTPRGGPGDVVAKERRIARTMRIPHYEIDDAIYADEVQGVREFGESNNLRTVQGQVQRRMADHVRLRLDPTLEYQRIGALKGIVLNWDGSTLIDLFDFLEVTQEDIVEFDLSESSPASGAIRRTCTDVVRTVSDNIEGLSFDHVHAFCGDAFFDDLIAAKECRETYLNQTEASQLREGVAFRQFNYGGIVFENYRGKVNGTPFIATDACHIFPVGAPGLFRTVYGPADWSETVNTLGLPRYAKQKPMANDKGVNIWVQMNALSYCTRPKVLMQGVRGSL